MLLLLLLLSSQSPSVRPYRLVLPRAASCPQPPTQPLQAVLVQKEEEPSTEQRVRDLEDVVVKLVSRCNLTDRLEAAEHKGLA